MKSFWSRFILGLITFVIYLFLVFPPDLQELIAGGVIALVLALLPLPGGEVFGEIKLWPKKVIFALIFLFVFFWAVIRSNLDVAFRVLRPSLPINPGIVKVKTKLKSRLGRLFLANSITLTPGTITVEVKGEDFFIHWINIDSMSVKESTEKIVTDFEKYLEVIFG